MTIPQVKLCSFGYTDDTFFGNSFKFALYHFDLKKIFTNREVAGLDKQYFTILKYTR